MTTVAEKLGRLGACDDAIRWARKFGQDHHRAWKACNRLEWLLWWLLRNEKGNRRRLAAAAADGIERFLPLVDKVSPGLQCVRWAIRILRKQARGNLRRNAHDNHTVAQTLQFAQECHRLGGFDGRNLAAGSVAFACRTALAFGPHFAFGNLKSAYWYAKVYPNPAHGNAAAGEAILCRILRKHFPVPPRLAKKEKS